MGDTTTRLRSRTPRISIGLKSRELLSDMEGSLRIERPFNILNGVHTTITSRQKRVNAAAADAHRSAPEETMSQSRIAVVGAGAVGGYIAGKLAASGRDV